MSSSDTDMVYHGLIKHNGQNRQLFLDPTRRNYIPIQSQTSPNWVSVMYDVDSMLMVPKSLGVCLEGLEICFYPSSQRNIMSDIHLFTKVKTRDSEKPLKLPYHKIPHLYLGRVTRFEECQVFVFFPRLYYAEKNNNLLTDSQIERWVDHILLPAITAELTSAELQHLPGSFVDAKARAEAKGREGGLRFQEQASARRTHLSYYIKNEVPRAAWLTVEAKVLEPGFHDFQDCQLLISSKNTKLRYRASSPETVLTHYMEYWKKVFQISDVEDEQMWIDIGKEYVVEKVATEDTEEKATLLWRSCCLQTRADRYKHIGRGNRVMTYNWAHCRDVASLTILLGK